MRRWCWELAHPGSDHLGWARPAPAACQRRPEASALWTAGCVPEISGVRSSNCGIQQVRAGQIHTRPALRMSGSPLQPGPGPRGARGRATSPCAGEGAAVLHALACHRRRTSPSFIGGSGLGALPTQSASCADVHGMGRLGLAGPAVITRGPERGADEEGQRDTCHHGWQARGTPPHRLQRQSRDLQKLEKARTRFLILTWIVQDERAL